MAAHYGDVAANTSGYGMSNKRKTYSTGYGTRQRIREDVYKYLKSGFVPQVIEQYLILSLNIDTKQARREISIVKNSLNRLNMGEVNGGKKI